MYNGIPASDGRRNTDEDVGRSSPQFAGIRE